MQRVIRKFSNDLAKEVRKSKYKRDVMSIVLLGSAARGEWIRGESDVDFIVVVREKENKKPVASFISKSLKRLNRKYNLKLEDACTDEQKKGNEILKAIFRIESSVFFGVPFRVISNDEYDFMKNKISNPRIWFLATFLGSVNSFLTNIKETGKIIYGKNLLKSINVGISFSDKVKINLEHCYILLAAMLILPFDGKLALKHALKASLYGEEFDLLLLHRHLKGYEKDRKMFENVFSKDKFAISHLRTTLYYRKHYNRINPDLAEAAHFISDSIKFVFISSIRV